MTFFDEQLTPLEAARDMDIFNAFETGFFPMFISGPWTTRRSSARSRALSQVDDSRDAGGKRGKLGARREDIRFRRLRNLVHRRLRSRDLQELAAQERGVAVHPVHESPRYQAEWYVLSKNLPARKVAWESKELSSNPYLAAFRLQLQNAKAPPALPEWELIASILSETFEQIVYKKTTIASGSRPATAGSTPL